MRSLDALFALHPCQRASSIRFWSTNDGIIFDLVIGDFPGREKGAGSDHQAKTQPNDNRSLEGKTSGGKWSETSLMQIWICHKRFEWNRVINVPILLLSVLWIRRLLTVWSSEVIVLLVMRWDGVVCSLALNDRQLCLPCPGRPRKPRSMWAGCHRPCAAQSSSYD